MTMSFSENILTEFFLDFPTCHSDQQTSYQVSLQDTVNVTCDVEEYDDDERLTFHWIFRSKYETIDIP